MTAEARASSGGRLFSVLAWTLLLGALWMWGRDLTEGGLSQVFTGGEESRQLSDGSHLPPARDPLPGSAAPVWVDIAAIGVAADIIPRGVEADGGIAPPPFETPDLAGWYQDGPSPGEAGAALLVGHVDTETELAVFYHLSGLEPGSEVSVTRTDDQVATFTVESVEVVDRGDFDPDAVYGAREAGRAELRLITCGGSFDRDTQSYSANVVVSAYLTDAGTSGAADRSADPGGSSQAAGGGVLVPGQAPETVATGSRTL